MDLVARVRERIGPVARPGGRPAAVGLYRSVVIVVFLLRHNVTQQVAAALFGVSQATMSRRWDLLRPVIAEVREPLIPAPAEIAGGSTVLVDGTLIPTWDWTCRSDLYSRHHKDHGFNLQVAAIRGERLVAVGDPVPGARHDSYAWTASGLADRLTGLRVAADLGYTGLGLITGRRRPPGEEHTPAQAEANAAIARFRSHHEHVIAHLKNWKMLSGRYRPPLSKLTEAVRSIVALQFFRTHFNPAYE